MSDIKATDLQSKVLSFHNKVLNPAKNTLGPQIPETAFSDRMSTAIRQVAKAQEEASISAKNFELGIENDLRKFANESSSPCIIESSSDIHNSFNNTAKIIRKASVPGCIQSKWPARS